MDLSLGQAFATLTVVYGAIVLAAATRFRRGPLVGPFSMSLLILISIFGIRPLLMVAREDFEFYGIDVVSGFNATCILGFLAVASISVGYAFGALVSRHRVIEFDGPNPPDAGYAPTLLRNAALLAVVAISSYVLVMMLVGGGVEFLAQLFAGRSAAVNSRSENLPVVVPALPVAAAAALAVCRIVVVRHRPLRKTEEVLYWASCVMLVLPPAALGNRRFLLPTALVMLIAAAYTRWNRPLGIRLAALGAVAFLALTIFPFVRSAGSRTGSTDLVGAMFEYFSTTGLSGTLDGFFLSYDTEMFNYVSFLAPRVGESIPLGFGRGTIGDALLAPIPAALAPVPSWSNYLLTSIFGTGCAQGVCPVPSLVGVFLYDFSFVGVVIGFLLVGLLMSNFTGALFRARGVRLAALMVFASFAPIVIRGNSIAILWIACNVLAASLVALAVLRGLHRRRAAVDTSKAISARSVAHRRSRYSSRSLVGGR